MNEETGSIRVVVADDHPVVLMGMKLILRESRKNLRIVGEAGSGKALLELIAKQPCDVLVTDFSMPDDSGSEDGLQLIRRLRRNHPDLPIIVMTMIRNPALVRGMFAAGANGVVGKADMARELLLALQAVTGGRTYVSSDLHEWLDRTVAPESLGETASVPVPEEMNLAALSPREAEVVRMYAGGLTVTQIAERLRRSVKTVSQQKNDAMRKLGLSSNSQLYEFARSSGLLT
jgi:two-component system capsular synthesis response regulator RcsB